MSSVLNLILLRMILSRFIPVKGIVRNLHSIKEYANRIETAQYSFDDLASVKVALSGCDVALSVIGSGAHSDAAKPTDIYSKSVNVLIKTLKETGKNKLIVISSGGVEYDEKAPWYFRYLFRPYLMNSYMDMMKMETILEENSEDIQWTIVRPTYLLDGESKSYLAENRKIEKGNFKIYRTDVADFILNEAKENKWIHRYSGLGYQ